MKLLIAVDMEGITGVTRWEHVSPGSAEYTRFRALMTEDVNAAISGAHSAGADQIIVSDGHADGLNILIEKLNLRATLNSGSTSPLAMVQGADSGLDAALFIGYHARAGTQNAILDHTWSGKLIGGLWLNDKPCGETGLNSAVLGHFGVPVLMVSGDQALAAEASGWIPGIESAVIKRATSRFSAECLPPEASQALIRKTAERAVKRFFQKNAPAPVLLDKPVTLTVEFLSSAFADGAEVMNGVKRLDGRRVQTTQPDMLAAYYAFRSIVRMSNV